MSSHLAQGSLEGVVVEEPLGRSEAVRAVRAELGRVAGLSSTVLLTGETGVGKGVVARELHRRSGRSGPFVHVDCAALAPSLVESELFGHERGAFTGAVSDRTGRFELAAGGTLLLDEIGELGPPLQGKLLRVLQDREFERIGGVRTLRMRARVVAATSRDLRREVAAGRFRADLYFRLAVVCLELPPLRERPEDVPVLAEVFLEALSRRLGLSPPQLSRELRVRLMRHSWPGNARELHNALERLLIRRPGRPATLSDLEEVMETDLWRCAAPGPRSDLPSAERIATVLRRAGGNVSRAARELGLPRTTLRRRILRQLGPEEGSASQPSAAATTRRSAITVSTAR
jgi:transcriptional regulator with GAF, ATPase, and Fis domain